MPPRAAFIEEFDDDMDIPLPSRPLPSTGTRGQIIEEIDIASDDHGPGTGINRGASSSSGRPGPSGSTAQQPPSRQAFSKMQEQVQVLQGADRSPYKTYVSWSTPVLSLLCSCSNTVIPSWNVIYPIYLDAKQPYGTARRIAREHSLWWPLSTDINAAANRLGLNTLHEMDKCHPKDWENPGRVRVLWKKDGKPVNARFSTSGYSFFPPSSVLYLLYMTMIYNVDHAVLQKNSSW
jgi:signal recognition particle subunit SRP19